MSKYDIYRDREKKEQGRSMALNFLSILSKVEKVAEPIGMAALGAYNPVLAPLVSLMVQGIKDAASKNKTGEEKKADVLQKLQDSAPLLEQLIVDRGGTIADAEKLVKGSSTMIDGLVEMMKATGQLPVGANPVPPTVIPVDVTVPPISNALVPDVISPIGTSTVNVKTPESLAVSGYLVDMKDGTMTLKLTWDKSQKPVP